MAFFGDMVDGFEKGQQFRKNYYENAKLAEEAKRYGEKLDMEQKMLGYKTGIAGTQNQYLPDEMKFANEHAALVNKYYGPNIQSEIQNRQANTESTRTNTKYKPLDELIKAQASTNSSKRFGASFQLRQALSSFNPADRAQWIADHQTEYSDMLTNLANGQHEPTGISPEVLQKFFPEMGVKTQQAGIPQPSPSGAAAMPVLPGGLQQTPQVPPMAPQGAASLYPQQHQGGIGAPLATQTPVMQQPYQQHQGGIGAPLATQAPVMQQPYQQQPFSYSTPEQNAALKKTGEMAANQYLTTAATRRQMEGAIQVEQIVNSPEVIEQVKNAAEYAGAAGRGKAALAAISQTNPKAYEDYIAFTHQTMPLIDNRIKTLDQMGSTDKQREELQGLRNKTMDALSSNPKQFIIQYNKLVKALDVVARAVQKSASPVANVNRLEGTKPIPEGKMVQVKLPDGRMGNIPTSNLDAALKMGAKKGFLMAKKDFDSLGFVPHGESESDPFAKLGFTTGDKSSPSENEPEKMGKFMSAVTGFNTGAGNFAHGVLQPLTESGLLGERVKNASKSVAKNRASDYKEAAEDNPTSAFLGNMAGGLAASSPLFAIPGVGTAGSVGRLASQGALQGAATGALSYGSPEERAMGGLVGGGLGAAAYPLAGKLGSANPLTKATAGGTLGAGGTYLATRGNEEGNNTAIALGGLAGAAVPFIPSVATQAFKNFVAKAQGKETKGLMAEQYETAAKNHLMGAITPKQAELALKNAGLARKEGLDYITMGEASGSPVVGAIEGRLSRTPKGQQEMFQRAEGRADSEVKSINSLLNQISKEGGPAQEKVRGAAQEFIKGKKEALQAKASPYYKKALEEENPPVDIKPVVEHIKDLQNNSAGEMTTALKKVMQDLGGEPKYSINAATGQRSITNPELVKMHNAKIAIDAMIEGRGDNSIARATKGELIGIQKKLLEQMDKASPDYKKARAIFAEGEGAVEGARALQAINNTEIAKRVANLSDVQLKQVSHNIFDPAQSDTKVIAKLRDRISSVDPQAWNQIVRNELERVMDKKDMSGFAFYKQNLQSERRFNQLMEATKNIPGASERLQNMRSIFKNLMSPPSARTEAGLSKTSMTGEREPIAALKNMMFKMAGSKFDLAQIELTTSPHWDKELAQIAKIKNKEAQASQFSGLLARVGTNMATNITQNNQKNRPSYDD